jgi:hypothetical protein
VECHLAYQLFLNFILDMFKCRHHFVCLEWGRHSIPNNWERIVIIEKEKRSNIYICNGRKEVVGWKKRWEVWMGVSVCWDEEAILFQRLSVALLRSDYLPDSTANSNSIKQVEINTIASSFAGVSSQICSLHRYVFTLYIFLFNIILYISLWLRGLAFFAFQFCGSCYKSQFHPPFTTRPSNAFYL